MFTNFLKLFNILFCVVCHIACFFPRLISSPSNSEFRSLERVCQNIIKIWWKRLLEYLWLRNRRIDATDTRPRPWRDSNRRVEATPMHLYRVCSTDPSMRTPNGISDLSYHQSLNRAYSNTVAYLSILTQTIATHPHPVGLNSNCSIHD